MTSTPGIQGGIVPRWNRLPATALSFAGSLALSACGEEAQGPPAPPTVEVAPEAYSTGKKEPPLGANGLLPSCFWAHGAQRALRTLGGGPLDDGDGALPEISTSLVPEECRQVLAAAVECALPEGQSVTDPVTGGSLEGWWGLAAGWRSAALDTAGRRHVTACLVQRLNATGTPVPILLEGPHPAIVRDPELAADHSIQESTAFGDLFSSQTPLLGILPAFNVFVCWEGLLPQSCGAAGLPLLEQRVCDDLPLCGLLALGPCSLVCAPNGPYHRCKPGLLSPYWTETVRVRLDPDTCE